MATFDLNRSTLPAFRDRVRAVTAGSERKWGQMDATRMMRHLGFTLEMSLGIARVPDMSKPILRDVFYVVFFQWLTTWPKGRIKGPDFVTPPPKADFSVEQLETLRLMDRFVEEFEREPMRLSVNPGLGPIPLSKWSRVHGVHMDHHMRQFGV